MTVADYPYEVSYGQALDVEIHYGGKSCPGRVYLEEDFGLKPGDRITGTFRLRITFQGGGNDPTYHRGDGIWLLAYQAGEVSAAVAAKTPLRDYPAVWRQALLERIDSLFSGDTAGFAKALILGERSGIDYARHFIISSGKDFF